MNATLARRELLRLIAAGAAASVAGCSRPEQTIYPAVNQPEGVQPGQAQRFATALPFQGYGRGVTGIVVDGRPVKLEGLASHPASLGATDLYNEVALLDLYDPQRIRNVGAPYGPGSWAALTRAMRDAVAPTRGDGVVLLTGRVTSPTLLARIAALKGALPGLRHVRWEPLNDDNALAGAELAFGRRLTMRPRLAEADTILCLEADPLGPGVDQILNGRAWKARRGRAGYAKLYVVEPTLTQTGMMADARLAGGTDAIARVCHDRTLEGNPSPVSPLFAPWEPRHGAYDLSSDPGAQLMLAGPDQSAQVHAFAAWYTQGVGAPVDWIAPVDPDPTPHRHALASLAADMHAGRVRALIVLDANPVYAEPAFAEAMKRVPFTLFAGTFPGETAAAAQWTAPIAHPLEGWHDWRAPDGTASIAQPLVRPFYDTRTASEFVDLIGDPAASASSYQRVRETWASLGESGWREAVTTGVVPNTAARPEQVGAARLVLPAVPNTPGYSLDRRVSPTLHDGRLSTNAWAQECPDPITKEVWGSSARLHPADMAALGVSDGDMLRLARGGGAVTVPARAAPGQARGVVTLLTGYGRQHSGAVADGIGANAFVLHGDGPLTVTKADGRLRVPSTQHQFALDGELEKLFPIVAPGAAMPKPAARPSLLAPPAPAPGQPQWAMAIDTDLCIGCNACVVSCQAENNVPVIGPEQIAVGRDMHWLRVDTYETDAGGGFQPVPCMQCEEAPCEPVCPVEASVHDSQGLNVQVYNRCVGTRTCQANCPYKVRRFNFLDYAGTSVWGDAGDASITAQRNPEVSVRARGVMEKCTYCVQRTSAAVREADATGQPIAPVQTACAAACPTDAIRFGTLADEAIVSARADPRHYALLEELGTRPRTTYLARRRDA